MGLPMSEVPATCLIVIPCLNEEAHLEKLVLGLLEFVDSKTTRIVIADGGSTDRTQDIAQKLAQNHAHISYLHNPKKLQSAAINLAVREYGSDVTFLIRIDAHADYPKDYCQTLLQEAMQTQAHAVVVAMRTIGLSPFQQAVAAAQNSKLGNGGSAHRNVEAKGRWVDHGHHALIRIESFRAVGGYDEGFMYNEDAELDYRLTKAGYKIWLTAHTYLNYYPRSSAGKLFRQYVGYGHGRARTIMKHGIIPKPRQMLPACIVPAMLLALATPWFPWAAWPLLLWLSLCLVYGFVLASRNREPQIMLAGPAALLMHTGWSLGFWQAVLSAWWRRS